MFSYTFMLSPSNRWDPKSTLSKLLRNGCTDLIQMEFSELEFTLFRKNLEHQHGILLTHIERIPYTEPEEVK